VGGVVEIHTDGTVTVHNPEPWPTVAAHVDDPTAEPTGDY